MLILLFDLALFCLRNEWEFQVIVLVYDACSGAIGLLLYMWLNL